MENVDRVRILLVEDDPFDAELIVLELRRAGLEPEYRRIEHDEELAQALQEPWDAVLCDFTLPGWDGLAALRRVRSTVPDVPFLFVSGSIGEDTAVAAMRAGANDYLLKGNLRRLAPALLREIEACRDRRRARATEQARRLTELRYGQVLETAADAIISVDSEQRIRTFNKGAERIFGYHCDEVLGLDLGVLLPARYDERHSRQIDHYIGLDSTERADTRHLEVVGRRRDGTEFPAHTSLSKSGEGGDLAVTAILRDVTAIKQSEERIRFLAHFDPLTHLPNRILFAERLDMAILEAERKGRRVAVAVLDLDRFKIVNDTRGHSAGDQMLVAVAARLAGSVRQDDTVARLGGDEFGIIMADLATEPDAGPIAEAIVRSLRLPLSGPSGGMFNTTGSLGVTVFPGDGHDPETLLANADLAMYRAKRAGGDRYEFYRPEMTARERDRAELEGDLIHSLRTEGLLVAFQPQIALAGGGVVGCEALARWQHPTRGAVPAPEFIRTAEESGLIVALGQEVLACAIAQAARWRHQLRNPIRVSVNASIAELCLPDYADRVLRLLDDHGLPSASLEIEVTEGDMAEEQRPAVLAMQRLEASGVTFAIDDFGTGFSNLSRLKQLPIRVLKIDKSLVGNLPHDSDDLAIVSAVITMAHRLGLVTIAEGVERPPQIETLTELGCDAIQGFVVATPMWPDDCLGFLKTVEESGGALRLR